jgi:hypothetical protein
VLHAPKNRTTGEENGIPMLLSAKKQNHMRRNRHSSAASSQNRFTGEIYTLW